MEKVIYNFDQKNECDRLVAFIRDHIRKHGGYGYDYYVGIAQSEEHYESRITDHKNEGYEVIEGTLDRIESNFSRVIKDVEYYFTTEAKEKNVEEWTLGKYGGCKYPHRLYIFKTKTLKLKPLYMASLVELGA